MTKTPAYFGLRRFLLPLVMLCCCSIFVQGKEDLAGCQPSLYLDNQNLLTVTLIIPPGLSVEQETFEVAWPEGWQPELLETQGLTVMEGENVFVNSAVQKYQLPAPPPSDFQVTVSWQACKEGFCYLPVTTVLTLGQPEGQQPSDNPLPQPPPGENSDLMQLLAGFEILASDGGYRDSQDLLAWIQNARSGQNSRADGWLDRAYRFGGMALLPFLLLAMGILLNLTPCVLPMIPVNLAILGASNRQGESPRAGFLLGGAYGLSMAIVYGVLGVIVVMTGSRFGALNSSPWFNWAVALVFVALALAMFDVFLLDFTRFRPAAGRFQRGSLLAAIFMGAMSALLSGACVAPVLLWVLVLSADLYVQGNHLALLLPFLLGLGMGLPWPFLGAGLAKLPRPGAWTVWVKRAFGLLMLLMAVSYLWLGFRLLHTAGEEDLLPGWRADLQTALAEAQANSQDVLLEFWGQACRSCALMKKTSWQAPPVVEALSGTCKISVCGDGDEADTAMLRQYFRIQGFPSYALLRPRQHNDQ